MITTNDLDQSRGTAMGIGALLLWSMVPSLIRLLSEAFGPITGAALVYSSATLVLILLMGWPSLKQFPRRYLLVIGSVFVAYEIALSLALGYAQDRAQAIELTLLNYLWPCLTAALTVLLRQQRASFWLVPGMLVSLLGVGWILSAGEGLSVEKMLANASENPLSYTLALSCAFLWSIYCCFAKRLAQGTDAIVPFFAMVSVTLWVKFIFSSETLSVPGMANVGLLIAAALALALGYAAWNKALVSGNLLLLAAASYTSPVLSTAFSSIILSTTLRFSFWQGAAMVTVGSLVCWWSTRRR